MKHAAYTSRCLEMAGKCVNDKEMDVKRATSFAVRLSTRGEIAETRKFLERRVLPTNPAATWVLCDIIRSMTKKFLPEFRNLSYPNMSSGLLIQIWLPKTTVRLKVR